MLYCKYRVDLCSTTFPFFLLNSTVSALQAGSWIEGRRGRFRYGCVTVYRWQWSLFSLCALQLYWTYQKIVKYRVDHCSTPVQFSSIALFCCPAGCTRTCSPVSGETPTAAPLPPPSLSATSGLTTVRSVQFRDNPRLGCPSKLVSIRNNRNWNRN